MFKNTWLMFSKNKIQRLGQLIDPFYRTFIEIMWVRIMDRMAKLSPDEI